MLLLNRLRVDIAILELFLTPFHFGTFMLSMLLKNGAIFVVPFMFQYIRTVPPTKIK